MEKKISNLQFITNYQSKKTHFEQVEATIQAGVDWIQYRPKDQDKETVLSEGKRISEFCRRQGTLCIINDHVDIAVQLDADGVHLGKNDMSPLEARAYLGETKIIGGTANTIEDIINLVSQGVDYIGLGPFQHTETKKNLSPILGLEGYKAIVRAMKQHHIEIPVVAIGGIAPEHVAEIRATGIYGIAVSSVLSEAAQIESTVEQLKQNLNI